MARQLIPKGTTTSYTGPWVRVEGAFKRGVPMRIQATGSFVAGVSGAPITIQELVAGLPGSPNTPFSPQSDTGDVAIVGTIASAGDDLLIENPIAFIRAITSSDLTGSIDYCGAEMLE